MKLGIMQPYFAPYIGYWQLMNAVDKYIIYDDVNFIKGGWINRNNILLNGESKRINIPMIGASSNKLINEVGFNSEKVLIDKNRRMLVAAYKNAPYFERTFSIIEEIFDYETDNLANFLTHSICVFARELNISTELIVSSRIEKNTDLKGQEKIIDICQRLEATEYYNAIGGQALYSFDDFSKAGILLNFLDTKDIKYKQFGTTFVPNLSIIDVMMFNNPEEIGCLLSEYRLIQG